jgi:hypothetical protein
MTGHHYTAEQLDYLRRHATSKRSLLAESFNARFGTALSEGAIKQTCLRRGIRTGRTGCFSPGNVPYNAGTKGLNVANCTSFKAGQMPQTWVPVGTEVIEAKDGYTKVKIANPRTWKFKHVLVWEKINGPVPKGKVIIFADRNKQNFAPDNLLDVDRRELLFLNRNALIHADRELTQTAVNIAKVAVRAAELRHPVGQSLVSRGQNSILSHETIKLSPANYEEIR